MGLMYKLDFDFEVFVMLNDWWIRIGKGKYVVLVGKFSKKKVWMFLFLLVIEFKVKEEDVDDF